MRVRALLMASIAMALLIAPTGAAAAPTGGPAVVMGVDVEIGACEYAGTTAPTTTVKVTHRSAAGAVKAKTQVTSDGSGDWVRPCPGPRVATGDTLEFRLIGETQPFRTFRIPALTLVTDRVFDRIRGTAPGVSSVVVAQGWCDPSGFSCFTDTDATVNVKPGTHRFLWRPPVPATGLSVAILSWAKGLDTVELRQAFAHVVVNLGSGRVTGVGPRRNQVETISLRRGDLVGLATPRTRTDAGFRGTFKRNGTTMKARIGDLVSSSIAGDASMTIPNVFLDVTGAGASGKCFKGQRVSVVFKDAAGEITGGDSGNANPDGTWTLGMALNAGWTADVWCANKHGDQVHLHGVAN